MKFFAGIFLVGALLGLASSEEATCNTPGCKSLADDLLHRSMDTTVDPCDDFDKYVCGNWAKYHPLPESAGRQSYFNIINDGVIESVSEAMHDATSKSKSKAVSFLSEVYEACNDTATREQRGTKPLADLINDVVGGWPILGKTGDNKPTIDWETIYTNIVSKSGLTPAFRFTAQYERQSQKKMLFLVPGTSGAPAQILVQENLYAKHVEAYKQYMHDGLVMMGAPQDAHLQKNIDKIYKFEKELAEALLAMPFNMARISTFKILKINFGEGVDMLNVMNNILKNLNSTQAAFTESDQLVTYNQEYLADAVKLFKATPVEVVQNYFGWLMTMAFGPGTTHKFRHAENEFRSTMTGIKHEMPDQQYCASVVNAKLPFAYARVYVDAAFTKEDKEEATSMVKELKKSFHNILQNNKWLDEETKAYAIKKLEKIRENIGYPDWLMIDADLDDYYNSLENVKVEKGKFSEAMFSMYSHEILREFNDLALPFNHSRAWPMTPATVNAAYMPIENSITIPAAILNSPFFDRDRPLSMNYGGIGAVIGHELTHGFDNNGRRFDENGNQKDWWSLETQRAFNEHALCFINQYGKIFDPTAQMNINGQMTLGENIADNGGVKESWYAYQAHQQTKASEHLPDVKHTADQLFFISFARNWCSIINKEMLVMQIRTNPHTPDKYRTLTVMKNSPEFAKAFSCPSTKAMNPEQKCAVW